MIFWLLNSRPGGTESGEWSMLDFEGRPSERFLAAGAIANVLEQNSALFRNAKPVEAPVTILLSLETMTLQSRSARLQPGGSLEGGNVRPLPGRGANAHMLAALAFYQALQELGVPTQIKFIHDFDWTRPAAKPLNPRLAGTSLGAQRRAI